MRHHCTKKNAAVYDMYIDRNLIGSRTLATLSHDILVSEEAILGLVKEAWGGGELPKCLMID